MRPPPPCPLAIIAPLAFGAILAAGPASVQIIGHRGGAESAPENTLSALRSGYADGADGCELDFRSTADGRLVVSHDANMLRCAGVDMEILLHTFDELRKLDVGHWGKWKEWGVKEVLPSLDEALATVPPSRKIFLHCYTSRLELGKVRDSIGRSGLKPEQVVLICFQRGPCASFKQLMPRSKAYWLVSRAGFNYESAALDRIIQEAKQDGLDGLDFDYRFPIDQAFVQKVHGAGLELHVWTLNDAGKARALASLGIDGITTDRAGWLRTQLGMASPQSTTNPNPP